MLKDLVKVEELYRLKGATVDNNKNTTANGKAQQPENIMDKITSSATANINPNTNTNANNNGVNLQLKKELLHHPKVTTGSNVGKSSQLRMLGEISSPSLKGDYMSKQYGQSSVGPMGSSNLYVGKRS